MRLAANSPVVGDSVSAGVLFFERFPTPRTCPALVRLVWWVVASGLGLGVGKPKQQGEIRNVSDGVAVDSPKSFIEQTPTSKLIRQIFGAFNEFQRDELVSRLSVARERKRAISGKLTVSGKGKCEGGKSLKEMNPEVAKNARRLYRRNPVSGKRRSLREVSRVLQGMVWQKENGTPYGT